MEHNLKKLLAAICIILCLSSACGRKNEVPNTPEIAESQTDENRIITLDTIPEKPVVEEFRSIALNKESADMLKAEYAIGTLFDCPYIKDGEMVELSQIALYGRTAEVFMHENMEGWELEEGSTVSFSLQSVSDDTELNLRGGVALNEDILSEVEITETEEVQSIEIGEAGTYYFYIMNCSDTDQMLNGLKIILE